MSSKYDITCQECEATYDVFSDNDNKPDYCPFCGEFVEDEPDDWDEDEEDEEEQDDWQP